MLTKREQESCQCVAGLLKCWMKKSDPNTIKPYIYCDAVSLVDKMTKQLRIGWVN